MKEIIIEWLSVERGNAMYSRYVGIVGKAMHSRYSRLCIVGTDGKLWPYLLTINDRKFDSRVIMWAILQSLTL